MDISEKRLRRLLWEVRILSGDPHHPVNDRRHPEHNQAVAALKQIEERGRRLLSAQAQRNG